MFTDIAKTTFMTQLGSVGSARARPHSRRKPTAADLFHQRQFSGDTFWSSRDQCWSFRSQECSANDRIWHASYDSQLLRLRQVNRGETENWTRWSNPRASRRLQSVRRLSPQAIGLWHCASFDGIGRTRMLVMEKDGNLLSQ